MTAAVDTARCRACRAPIWWGLTSPGQKLMPLDPTPAETGNVVISADELTQRKLASLLVTDPPPKDQPAPVRVLRKDEERDPDVARYLPHFATCPEAARFRKAAAR